MSDNRYFIVGRRRGDKKIIRVEYSKEDFYTRLASDKTPIHWRFIVQNGKRILKKESFVQSEVRINDWIDEYHCSHR